MHVFAATPLTSIPQAHLTLIFQAISHMQAAPLPPPPAQTKNAVHFVPSFAAMSRRFRFFRQARQSHFVEAARCRKGAASFPKNREIVLSLANHPQATSAQQLKLHRPNNCNVSLHVSGIHNSFGHADCPRRAPDMSLEPKISHLRKGLLRRSHLDLDQEHFPLPRLSELVGSRAAAAFQRSIEDVGQGRKEGGFACQEARSFFAKLFARPKATLKGSCRFLSFPVFASYMGEQVVGGTLSNSFGSPLSSEFSPPAPEGPSTPSKRPALATLSNFLEASAALPSTCSWTASTGRACSSC